MSQFDDFLAQIESLPTLVSDLATSLEPPTRTLFTTPEIYGFRQIVLTGSGDSYFAAAAVAPVLRAWTALPVQAMTAMEAARYMDLGQPPRAAGANGLLVLAVSYSGEAARVVEATRRLRAVGALTAAITARPSARLALSADRMLDTTIADSPAAPGTRSYMASLIALYLIAIRIAEVRITMTMDSANLLRSELIDIGRRMQGLTGRITPLIDARSAAWRPFRTFDVLGSGPSLATASYAAAKLVEAAGVHAAAQDIEEFHHLNYFVDAPSEMPTIVFAPSSAASASRADELADTLAQLGRPRLLVTDENAAEGDVRLPVCDELLAPIVQTVPAALLAAFLARDRAVPHYRAHSGPWAGAQGANLVKNSPILTRAEQ